MKQPAGMLGEGMYDRILASHATVLARRRDGIRRVRWTALFALLHVPQKLPITGKTHNHMLLE